MLAQSSLDDVLGRTNTIEKLLNGAQVVDPCSSIFHLTVRYPRAPFTFLHPSSQSPKLGILAYLTNFILRGDLLSNDQHVPVFASNKCNTGQGQELHAARPQHSTAQQSSRPDSRSVRAAQSELGCDEGSRGYTCSAVSFCFYHAEYA